MENSHRPVISWHLIPVIGFSVRSKHRSNKMVILNVSFWFQILIKCSSIYRFEKLEGRPFSISDSDYFVFHSPYNKVIVMQELFHHIWNENEKAEKYVITRPTMTLHNCFLDVLQLVQKSFGRLYFNDFMRNLRFLFLLPYIL